MARIRRSASSNAIRPWASSASSLRAWRRRRDEIVWRLFFTRWWTSRMVASLVSSSRSRRRRSVTSRTRIAAPVSSPRRDERDAADHQDDVRPTLNLFDHRDPARERLVDDGGLEPELRQARTDDRGRDRRPVECVDGVGRRVRDPLAGVHHEHAVTDPGSLLDPGVVVDEGEQPVGDHHRQPLEQLEVHPLERAAAPGRPRRPDPA